MSAVTPRCLPRLSGIAAGTVLMSCPGEGSSVLPVPGGWLPAETSGFFGRSQEAAAVRDALAGSRLVTVTGPGGVGKTRLALRVAGELTASFPDGMFFADLSAAADAAGVARAVAAALRPAARGRPRPGPSQLAARLQGRRLLLVLDTGEHVIDACAALAEAILRAGDGPVLLLTSRQTLDLPGEVVLRVPPLPAGDDGGDAVALFADRAAAAVPGFEVTPALLPRLVQLSRLLDGLPLAIELAALRLRAVGLDELLARLPGQQLRLAGGRRAAAGGRQQSLAASAGWSYRLCAPDEQRLWTRLAVFADGFDLAAAEAVGGTGVLGPLIGLVDKSVVLPVTGAAGLARYRLLAVTREYGAAQAADGPADQARHRGYYLGRARAFAAAFACPEPGVRRRARVAHRRAGPGRGQPAAGAGGRAGRGRRRARRPSWPPRAGRGWCARAGWPRRAAGWRARPGQRQSQTVRPNDGVAPPRPPSSSCRWCRSWTARSPTCAAVRTRSARPAAPGCRPGCPQGSSGCAAGRRGPGGRPRGARAIPSRRPPGSGRDSSCWLAP